MNYRQQQDPILFVCHSDGDIVQEIKRMQWEVRQVSNLVSPPLHSRMEGVQVADKDKFFSFTKGRILTMDY